MKLNLTRPIVFFDLETTGVDTAKDRIVEISLLKVYPDQHEETHTWRVNPEMQIPESATAIHHITNDDVANAPTFRQLAKNIADIIQGCDLGGYNSNKFDIPLLAEEFNRVGVDVDLRKHLWIDVQNIFHKMERRTLIAAYRFYCDKELDGAHAADADIRATYEVLMAQLDRYPNDLKNDMKFLADFTTMQRVVDFAGRFAYNDKDEIIFAFGKHKGKTVVDVLRAEPSYYAWMMNGDFPEDTKRILTRIKLQNNV